MHGFSGCVCVCVLVRHGYAPIYNLCDILYLCYGFLSRITYVCHKRKCFGISFTCF